MLNQAADTFSKMFFHKLLCIHFSLLREITMFMHKKENALNNYLFIIIQSI